jgi:hypothetical protein
MLLTILKLHSVPLRDCPAKIDLAESGINRQVYHKGRGAENFSLFSPSSAI